MLSTSTRPSRKALTRVTLGSSTACRGAIHGSLPSCSPRLPMLCSACPAREGLTLPGPVPGTRRLSPPLPRPPCPVGVGTGGGKWERGAARGGGTQAGSAAPCSVDGDMGGDKQGGSWHVAWGQEWLCPPCRPCPSLGSLFPFGTPLPPQGLFGAPFPAWHPHRLCGPCPFWGPHPSLWSPSFLAIPIPP